MAGKCIFPCCLLIIILCAGLGGRSAVQNAGPISHINYRASIPNMEEFVGSSLAEQDNFEDGNASLMAVVPTELHQVTQSDLVLVNLATSLQLHGQSFPDDTWVKLGKTGCGGNGATDVITGGEGRAVDLTSLAKSWAQVSFIPAEEYPTGAYFCYSFEGNAANYTMFTDPYSGNITKLYIYQPSISHVQLNHAPYLHEVTTFYLAGLGLTTRSKIKIAQFCSGDAYFNATLGAHGQYIKTANAEGTRASIDFTFRQTEAQVQICFDYHGDDNYIQFSGHSDTLTDGIHIATAPPGVYFTNYRDDTYTLHGMGLTENSKLIFSSNCQGDTLSGSALQPELCLDYNGDGGVVTGFTNDLYAVTDRPKPLLGGLFCSASPEDDEESGQRNEKTEENCVVTTEEAIAFTYASVASAFILGGLVAFGGGQTGPGVTMPGGLGVLYQMQWVTVVSNMNVEFPPAFSQLASSVQWSTLNVAFPFLRDDLDNTAGILRKDEHEWLRGEGFGDTELLAGYTAKEGFVSCLMCIVAGLILISCCTCRMHFCITLLSNCRSKPGGYLYQFFTASSYVRCPTMPLVFAMFFFQGVCMACFSVMMIDPAFAAVAIVTLLLFAIPFSFFSVWLCLYHRKKTKYIYIRAPRESLLQRTINVLNAANAGGRSLNPVDRARMCKRLCRSSCLIFNHRKGKWLGDKAFMRKFGMFFTPYRRNSQFWFPFTTATKFWFAVVVFIGNPFVSGWVQATIFLVERCFEWLYVVISRPWIARYDNHKEAMFLFNDIVMLCFIIILDLFSRRLAHESMSLEDASVLQGWLLATALAGIVGRSILQWFEVMFMVMTSEVIPKSCKWCLRVAGSNQGEEVLVRANVRALAFAPVTAGIVVPIDDEDEKAKKKEKELENTPRVSELSSRDSLEVRELEFDPDGVRVYELDDDEDLNKTRKAPTLGDDFEKARMKEENNKMRLAEREERQRLFYEERNRLKECFRMEDEERFARKLEEWNQSQDKLAQELVERDKDMERKKLEAVKASTEKEYMDLLAWEANKKRLGKKVATQFKALLAKRKLERIEMKRLQKEKDTARQAWEIKQMTINDRAERRRRFQEEVRRMKEVKWMERSDLKSRWREALEKQESNRIALKVIRKFRQNCIATRRLREYRAHYASEQEAGRTKQLEDFVQVPSFIIKVRDRGLGFNKLSEGQGSSSSMLGLGLPDRQDMTKTVFQRKKLKQIYAKPHQASPSGKNLLSDFQVGSSFALPKRAGAVETVERPQADFRLYDGRNVAGVEFAIGSDTLGEVSHNPLAASKAAWKTPAAPSTGGGVSSGVPAVIKVPRRPLPSGQDSNRSGSSVASILGGAALPPPLPKRVNRSNDSSPRSGNPSPRGVIPMIPPAKRLLPTKAGGSIIVPQFPQPANVYSDDESPRGFVAPPNMRRPLPPGSTTAQAAPVGMHIVLDSGKAPLAGSRSKGDGASTLPHVDSFKMDGRNSK